MLLAMRGAWLLLGLILLGCQDDGMTSVEVLAASSLREVTTELARTYERGHPQPPITPRFAGSHVLRAQAEAGARFEVFIAANRQQPELLRQRGLAEDAVAVASNHLVWVVSDETKTTSFWQLPEVGRLVIGAPGSPIGAYTRRALHNAERRRGAAFVRRFDAAVVSREANTRLVVAKLTHGRAGGAVIYHTDAIVAGLRGHRLPAEIDVPARVYAAPSRRATTAARRWLTWIRGPEASAIWRKHGFEVP